MAIFYMVGDVDGKPIPGTEARDWAGARLNGLAYLRDWPNTAVPPLQILHVVTRMEGYIRP